MSLSNAVKVLSDGELTQTEKIQCDANYDRVLDPSDAQRNLDIVAGTNMPMWDNVTGDVKFSGRTRMVFWDPKTPDGYACYSAGVAGHLSWNADIRDPESKWEHVHQMLGRCVSCMCSDPNDPLTMWAGTGEAVFSTEGWLRQDEQNGQGIFKTTDGGVNWERIPLQDSRPGGTSVWSVEIFQGVPVMLAVSPGYRSPDYGMSFNYLGSVVLELQDTGTSFAFPTDIPQDGPFMFPDAVEIAFTEPIFADQPLTNPSAVAGKIAVVSRGECTFTLKIRHCQEAGAIGVIIGNNNPEEPLNSFIHAPEDDPQGIVSIPTIFINYDERVELFTTMEQNTLLPMSMNTTGQVFSAEANLHYADSGDIILPLVTSGSYSPMYVHNDKLYTAMDGTVYSLDSLDGEWSSEVAMAGATDQFGRLAFDGDEIYLYSSGGTLAKKTGTTWGTITTNIGTIGSWTSTQSGYSFGLHVNPNAQPDPVLFILNTTLCRRVGNNDPEVVVEASDVNHVQEAGWDWHTMAAHPTDPAVAIAAADCGVLYTDKYNVSSDSEGSWAGKHEFQQRSYGLGQLQPYSFDIRSNTTGNEFTAGFQDRNSWYYDPAQFGDVPGLEMGGAAKTWGGDGMENAIVNSDPSVSIQSSQYGNHGVLYNAGPIQAELWGVVEPPWFGYAVNLKGNWSNHLVLHEPQSKIYTHQSGPRVPDDWCTSIAYSDADNTFTVAYDTAAGTLVPDTGRKLFVCKEADFSKAVAWTQEGEGDYVDYMTNTGLPRSDISQTAMWSSTAGQVLSPNGTVTSAPDWNEPLYMWLCADRTTDINSTVVKLTGVGSDGTVVFETIVGKQLVTYVYPPSTSWGWGTTSLVVLRGTENVYLGSDYNDILISKWSTDTEATLINVDDAQVIRYTDTGGLVIDNIEVLYEPTASDVSVVDFQEGTAPQHFIMATAEQKVYISADDCATWDNITGDLNTDLTDEQEWRKGITNATFHPTDPNQAFVTTFGAGVWWCRDLGASSIVWEFAGPHSMAACWGPVRTRALDNTLWIQTHGLGLWKLQCHAAETNSVIAKAMRGPRPKRPTVRRIVADPKRKARYAKLNKAIAVANNPRRRKAEKKKLKTRKGGAKM